MRPWMQSAERGGRRLLPSSLSSAPCRRRSRYRPHAGGFCCATSLKRRPQTPGALLRTVLYHETAKSAVVCATLRQGLVEAAVRSPELRLAAQRGHRSDRARCAQRRIAELEEGVSPTGTGTVGATGEGPAARRRLDLPAGRWLDVAEGHGPPSPASSRRPTEPTTERVGGYIPPCSARRNVYILRCAAR
jgi:hypothetical protein